MSKKSIPVCRSKTVPCPAGERCPQHQGLIAYASEALKDNDLGRYLALKDEQSDEETKRRHRELVAHTSIRQKANGDLVVRRDIAGSVLAVTQEYRDGTMQTNHFLPHGGRRDVLPAPSTADRIDKTQRIYPLERDVDGKPYRNRDEAFKAAVERLYEGRVTVERRKSNVDEAFAPTITVPEEWKGKGVEGHVLASWMVLQRDDLYNFFGDDDIPAEAYIEKGWEPNPFVWAGKTHPVTGKTYPSKEQLESLFDRDQNRETFHLYSQMRSADRVKQPWMRLKGGFRFDAMPDTLEGARSIQKEQRLEIGAAEMHRVQQFQRARGGLGVGYGTTNV